MDVFKQCRDISELLNQGKEEEARNTLIQLLQELKDTQTEYTPLVNHLIRETGLYPYINVETADWQERFIVEAFKTNVGGGNEVTLHREQSAVLKALLNGESLAISAPTSFGKSFIIDAFIEIKRPNTAVIVVPTLALTDETRRRLYKKFGREYNVITTTGVDLGEKNLFIFPQERALQYVDEIELIDILIVDEFYKAGIVRGGSEEQDERASLLIEAISQLGKKSSQRYFLAPNISDLQSVPLTRDLCFKRIDFNTVYTRVERVYELLTKKDRKSQKFQYLQNILQGTSHKSIIYVNSHPELKLVGNRMADFLEDSSVPFLQDFSQWLKLHYGEDYILAKLVKKKIGIHSGQLHRSLAQIQIKLFEQEDGLKYLVSTSSLIEGVNTSAGNVIIWSKKRGRSKFDYFTYKNIIGRSGRMFKHFIGDVYLLEEPPAEKETTLAIEYPETLLERIDPEKYSGELTPEQITQIKKAEIEMDTFLGPGGYRRVLQETASQGVSKERLVEIIKSIKDSSEEWERKLPSLNSSDPRAWREALFLIVPLLRKVRYFKGSNTRMVHFIQALSFNWKNSIPELIGNLRDDGITIDGYFELEKLISFDFVTLLRSINAVAKRMLNPDLDISSFFVRASNAFMPSLVFELEEYGLPRMISRKLHLEEVINLEDKDCSINEAIDIFRNIGIEKICRTNGLSNVDVFILQHFFDGIIPTP